MNHPILNRIWKPIIYVIICSLIAYGYYSYLTLTNEISETFILVETIISFLIIAAINLGIWYFIKYNKIEDKRTYNFIINYIVSGIIIVISFILITFLIMIFVTKNNSNYTDYYYKTIGFKILVGFLIYVFVSLYYYIVIYYNTNKENLIHKNELNLMLKQQELSNLKSQINPHFLFNSLNSISYLIYSNPDLAHNSIVLLSDYFRFSLSMSKNQFSTIKEEIENVKRYFDIEKIRFSNKMKIEFNIDEKCLNYEIPAMILQPLAENSVKHGVYENTEITEILINISDNSDFFSITILNNFDEHAKLKKGTGSGLSITKQRLSLTYKRDDLMKVTKKENEFEVRILIPKI